MGVLSNYGRTCEGCGSRMPPFFPRKRDDDGRLLCDLCIDRKTAGQARAILHYARQQGRKLAHDSGDGETIYHCCFCGAGQVTARSDGSAECGFCGTVFTVQVQPKQPSQPQTIDGEPQKMPDMPGDQPGQPEPDEEPVDEETELPPGEGEDNMDDMGTDPAEEGNPFLEKKPASKTAGINKVRVRGDIEMQTRHSGGHTNWTLPAGEYEVTEVFADGDVAIQFEGKEIILSPGEFSNVIESKYRTAQGAVLDEDDYIRHLAIRHAEDRDSVIAEVRASREG